MKMFDYKNYILSKAVDRSCSQAEAEEQGYRLVDAISGDLLATDKDFHNVTLKTRDELYILLHQQNVSVVYDGLMYQITTFIEKPKECEVWYVMLSQDLEKCVIAQGKSLR